jgi:hypothetical protein
MTVALVAVKELQKRAMLLDMRQGSHVHLLEPCSRPRATHARLLCRGTDISTRPLP